MSDSNDKTGIGGFFNELGKGLGGIAEIPVIVVQQLGELAIETAKAANEALELTEPHGLGLAAAKDVFGSKEKE